MAPKRAINPSAALMRVASVLEGIESPQEWRNRTVNEAELSMQFGTSTDRLRVGGGEGRPVFWSDADSQPGLTLTANLFC